MLMIFQLEGTFKISYEQQDVDANSASISEKELCRFDIGFQHKSDDEILHNLDIALKMNNFHNSKKLQLAAFVEHVDTRKRQWRVSEAMANLNLCSKFVLLKIIF